MLKKWEELPENMRTDAVRPYYDILAGKKKALAGKRSGLLMQSGQRIKGRFFIVRRELPLMVRNSVYLSSGQWLWMQIRRER